MNDFEREPSIPFHTTEMADIDRSTTAHTQVNVETLETESSEYKKRLGEKIAIGAGALALAGANIYALAFAMNKYNAIPFLVVTVDALVFLGIHDYLDDDPDLYG